MSKYLYYNDLEAMSMELKVYDVDQGGWEHEGKGFEFNVNHTLKELIRAGRKDFFDPTVVRAELAPDAMQYAFRIARWTRFKRELILPTADIKAAADYQAIGIRTASRRIGAYAAGEILLADFAHRLDHESERREAQQTKFDTLPRVSQALVLFAEDSANEYNFSLRGSFAERLSNLRERFSIPQPN